MSFRRLSLRGPRRRGLTSCVVLNPYCYLPSEPNADSDRGRHREDVDGAVIMEEQGADAAEDDDDDDGGEEGKVNDSHSQSAVRGVGRPLTLSTVSTLYFLPPPPPPSPTHRPSSITQSE